MKVVSGTLGAHPPVWETGRNGTPEKKKIKNRKPKIKEAVTYVLDHTGYKFSAKLAPHYPSPKLPSTRVG
jgi:hypothetical protein